METTKEFQEMKLETLGGGAAAEMFNAEIENMILNIADPNTDPEAVREITLKVSVKPQATRDKAIVGIQVKTKFAPANPFATMIFIGMDNGIMKAVESNPQQPELPFDNIQQLAGGGK